MSHSLAGARGQVRDRDATIREAAAWATSKGMDVLLADASAVFGPDHLESAVLHAERARSRETMATRSESMETLLYLAGKRQVTEAIAAAGIRDALETVAVVVFGGASADELIARLGWTRDDSVLSASGKDLSRLGIGAAERATVGVERVTDLALERVALVDAAK